MKSIISTITTTAVFLSVLISSVYATAQDEVVAEPPVANTTIAEAAPTSNYVCTLNGMTRRIEIAYDSAGSSVPCSVNYYKETELPGEVSTLWQANNTEGYCEDRAEVFSEKLTSWGWACTAPE